MTASPVQPTTVQRPRPILGFARRLGLQAVLSVTVMAGLQLAAVHGYDVRDLLPAPAPEASGTTPPASEPVRVVGVPVRFDLPVQAGSALDHLTPMPPAETVSAAETAGPSAPVAAPVVEPVLGAVARPRVDRVAVPTPRPRLADARPIAVPPRPSEVPFDVTPRGPEVYGVAELADEERVPMPIEIAHAGFRVGDLLPSGPALLTRTAEVTGSAADAVTGTASRLLDLVR